MGLRLTTVFQGFRLPQRSTASIRFRAARTEFHVRRTRTLLRRSALALLILPGLCSQPLRAQKLPTPHATTNLTAAWQPLGPGSVLTAAYGNVTGRVAAIATDPNDLTGNTVYLGTTGGGVWKSTNAAGSLSAVRFAPLTDTLPVFSNNAGSSVVPSLTIGALAVQPQANPVLIAGTGDPNNATDSYYGEGLLRSADGGLTWALIQGSQDGANGMHSFVGLATAGIAFGTATPGIVVAAFTTSAEGAVVGAALVNSVAGLYYSTDAGLTWQMATIQDGSTIVQTPQPLGTAQVGNAVTSVVWDPVRAKFYAAVRSHGYYSSPDGITWTRLTAQPGTSLTVANCPVGNGGVGSANCPIYRGALAVQAATGDLYALTVDANNLDQGLWQDLCAATSGACANTAPTFANRIDQGALEAGSVSTAIPQGSYNLVLSAAASAANGTSLYVGTVDLYNCTFAAGTSVCGLRNTTNVLDGCNAPAQVGGAQHGLATVAQTSGVPLLFLGNDSGLWRSLDGVAETGSVCSASDSTHFDNLNAAIAAGGSLGEVVGFAQSPSNSNTLIAGLGANGSAATSAASALTPWPQLSAGEGGYPLIDAATPANWYATIGVGVNLDTCPLGSNCAAANFLPPATIGAAQVSADNSLMDTPTLLDPALTTSLLIGTCRVWRGAAGNGSAWSNANALSPAMGGATVPCGLYSPMIRSIAAGGPSVTAANLQNSGSTVIYAGMAGAADGGGAIPGHLFVTKSANTATSTKAWTDISLSTVTNDVSDAHVFNPQHFDVSSIAVDPHDATGGTVYATVMGFLVPQLYRSTNFGGSWVNISANLPNSPANSVVVDPNDANTVYVATDAGVFVTQTVLICATSNCWSVLGTALRNSPITSLAAGVNLATGDGRVGLLRAGTYGRGLWQTPLLTATSVSQAAISLSATSLTFATQQVGTQSAAQTITITSLGNTPVVFGSLVIAGDFTETDTCAGQTLAVGTSCSVQILFAPTMIGARTGQLTLYANVAGGQATVALSGSGTTPASVVLTPPVLTFPATIVNQTAASQNIAVSNTGGTIATLSAPALSGNTGDFAIHANSCGSTLAASTGCTVTITFTPKANGARSATLSVTDNAGTAAAATQTASLTGIGDAPATDTLTPVALSFASQQIGTNSNSQSVTLTNSGGVPLTLIAASVSAGDFAVVNACGNSLAAHATCAFNVTFSPTAVGARTATLTVTDQFHFQTVALAGTGVAGAGVSLTPTSLSFPATGVGLTALPQTLTLTNNGGMPLTMSNVVLSPGFVVALNSCSSTLTVNASCSLTIVFAPTTAGASAGTLTFTDNAASGVQTTSLSGVGVDFALTSTGATSATVAASGASVAYALQLSSLAGLSGNVALSCSGAPADSTCVVTPGVGPLGTTVPVVVTVETAVSAVARNAPPGRPFARTSKAALLALLLPFAIWQRRRFPWLARLLILTCVFGGLSGCGASRTIPASGTGGGGGTPTPTGTSTLTISASAAGLTHSVSLTLVVQ